MIAEWIAVGVIVAIGIFLLQMEHHARKVKIIIVTLIGLLLYFSILGIFSSEDTDFTSPKSIINGVYLYMGWMGETASSLWNIGGDTVSLVGNAIKVNETEERPRR
jgi:hypothetical protein|tara:strand:- start:73 stop:390 length:318 start_codon:yes stop_codon:yes gene_type:complete